MDSSPNPHHKSPRDASGVLTHAPQKKHSGRPDILSTPMSAVGLLVALGRRWKLALTLGILAGALGAGGAWFSQKERFRARTLIHVESTRRNPITGVERIDLNSFQRNQVAYAKSRYVLNAALRNPKVNALETIKSQEDPVLFLENQLQVDFGVAPEILRIQLVGPRPTDLVTIVESVSKTYIDEIVSKERNARNKLFERQKAQLEKQDEKLDGKRKLLRNLSEDLGTAKKAQIIQAMQDLKWKELDSLQTEKIQTESKLLRLRMELSIEQGRIPAAAGATDQQLEKIANEQPAVRDFDAHIAQHEVTLGKFRQRVDQPENEPQFKRLQQVIATLKAQRDEWTKSFVDRMKSGEKTLVPAPPDQVAATQQSIAHQIAVLEPINKWLGEQVEVRLNGLEVVNKRRSDVEWLKEELAVSEDLVKRLRVQVETLEMEIAAMATNSQPTMEEAVSFLDSDNRLRTAGMAGAGLFGLVLGLISLLEYRTRKVTSVDDVSQGLNIRIVGAIPSLPGSARGGYGDKPKNQSQGEWRRRMAESVDAIRTLLLASTRSERLQVLAVTSAVSGEGKTMTSSQLAVSLARAGRKTLLVDGDMRRPSIQRLFGVEHDIGLAEILRGEIDIASATRNTQIPHLSLICSGVGDDIAIAEMSSYRFEDFIEEIRSLYEFIIIDTTPVLPVPDSQMVCQHCDAVILAVLRNHSRLPLVYAAYERIVMLGRRILGAVVNGENGSAYTRSYVQTVGK